jgi:hypothetical protein
VIRYGIPTLIDAISRSNTRASLYEAAVISEGSPGCRGVRTKLAGLVTDEHLCVRR